MKEGCEVFYIDGEEVHSGKVTEIEEDRDGFLFSIDSYGDCSGQYRISSDQIGRTVFLDRKEAERAAGADRPDSRADR